MLGVFGLFGRSQDLQSLDRALRAAGLHPRIVPDAVKLVTVKELKTTAGNVAPDARAYESAALLLAYGIMGPQDFIEANDPARAERVEARILAALESGDSEDARLIMLIMQAHMIHADVVARFGLSME